MAIEACFEQLALRHIDLPHAFPSRQRDTRDGDKQKQEAAGAPGNMITDITWGHVWDGVVVVASVEAGGHGWHSHRAAPTVSYTNARQQVQRLLNKYQ